MKKILLAILSLLLISSQSFAGFGGYLKADTQTNVTIGPVVDVSDGYTPITNLSVSTADEAEIIKHAATSVTDISSNTFTAITNADGYYYLTITAGQLDTEGRITVLINDDSLCLPVRSDFEVVNANVYASLYEVGTTYLKVDIAQVGTDAITDNGDGRLEVNVEEWNDTAVNADTAGYPSVTIKDGTGTGELDTDSGTVLLRSATETQIDNIETDTAAMDTSTELRTLLTGSDTAVSTLTTSDNIGINLDDVSGTLDDSEVANDVQVDVVTIETSDATNQIRDAVVDDATRIDASSVNAVEAKVDTIDSNVDAILVDTNDLETDLNDGVALTSTTETQIDNIETKVKRIR